MDFPTVWLAGGVIHVLGHPIQPFSAWDLASPLRSITLNWSLFSQTWLDGIRLSAQSCFCVTPAFVLCTSSDPASRLLTPHQVHRARHGVFDPFGYRPPDSVCVVLLEVMSAWTKVDKSAVLKDVTPPNYQEAHRSGVS
jgi:hypothetical protein